MRILFCLADLSGHLKTEGAGLLNTPMDLNC